MKPQPCCKAVRPWLKANLGKKCLAPLTSTDARALDAAVHIIELSAYCGSPMVIDAFEMVVMQMQTHTRYLAYHAIAMVMDWSDRERVWRMTCLDQPHIKVLCVYEPGGSGVEHD